MKTIIIIIFSYIIPSFVFGQTKDSLELYIQIALENNPGLNAEYKAYEASSEKVSQFKSLPDPTISFGYFISSPETRLGPQNAKISVKQMFPWFGTLDAKGKQADYMAQSEYFKYISSKAKIEYSVKKVYYNLYLIQKSKHIIEKQIDIFKMLEQQALIKSETGQTSIAEVLQFQMAEDELKNKLKNLTNMEESTAVQFNILLNRDKYTDIFIVDSLFYQPELNFSQDSVLNNNPMVKRSDELIFYSEYLQKESKLSKYPKIGLGLDYVFVGKRTDLNPENNGKDIIMPMVSLSIPVFGKKYKAKIAESELKEKEFTLNKEAVKNDLTSEYVSNLNEFESAKNDYNLYKGLIIKAEQALGILNTAYETSGKDYDQVLNLQNKVLSYRLGLLNALVKMKISESYLEYLSNQ